MAKGVFMSGVNPSYDDIPEVRYHFPKRYLNQAQRCVGDWIVYYEPRQNRGRMCYFATARVDRIESDPNIPDHFYAFVSDYLEFPAPVDYRDGDVFRESALKKADGSVNKGALGWAIRHLPEHEYMEIVRLGMEPATGSIAGESDEAPATNGMVRETDADLEIRTPHIPQIITRPYRDRVFTRRVQETYNYTCALTGIRLVNGGGSCEIEAAHVKSVDDQGPDSVRNGIAMSRTLHWSFDHNIISLDDDGRILIAKNLLPEQLQRLLNPDGYARFPDGRALRPHPIFLRFHREKFKG